MPDPTEFVITATFSTALGIFAVTAILRKLLEKNMPPVPELGSGVTDASWNDEPPYQAPIAAEPPELHPPGRVTTWFYQPIDLIGIGFVFVLYFSLIIGSVRSSGKEEVVVEPGGLIATIAFQFIVAGVVTFFVIRRIRPVDWLGLRWRSWPWMILIAPGAVMAMWIIFGGLQAIGLMDWIESFGVETVQDSVKLLQNSSDPLMIGLMIIAAVVAAPLCEEIVFRGYFYPVMKKFSGTWVAGLCSALVFAAAHGSLTALLPLFIFGCVLVFIYEKTGSIWAPVAVHCCFNSATVITQIVARYYHLPLDVSP